LHSGTNPNKLLFAMFDKVLFIDKHLDISAVYNDKYQEYLSLSKQHQHIYSKIAPNLVNN